MKLINFALKQEATSGNKSVHPVKKQRSIAGPRACKNNFSLHKYARHVHNTNVL